MSHNLHPLPLLPPADQPDQYNDAQVAANHEEQAGNVRDGEQHAGWPEEAANQELQPRANEQAAENPVAGQGHEEQQAGVSEQQEQQQEDEDYDEEEPGCECGRQRSVIDRGGQGSGGAKEGRDEGQQDGCRAESARQENAIDRGVREGVGVSEGIFVCMCVIDREVGE